MKSYMQSVKRMNRAKELAGKRRTIDPLKDESMKDIESISILTIENDIFEMKATTGDTHFSCEDCDDGIVNFYMQVFQTEEPTQR